MFKSGFQALLGWDMCGRTSPHSSPVTATSTSGGVAGPSCFSGDHLLPVRPLPACNRHGPRLCRRSPGLAPDLTALFGLHPSAVYAFLNPIVGVTRGPSLRRWLRIADWPRHKVDFMQIPENLVNPKQPKAKL